ncbi:ABC transporter substrate-binding protein [Actinomadura rayongensis]|uniref:Extracellular solute-binding protein n=1 Tax=Actinomadura rayongensis TaxID=1429076 RepID=A0A6I4W660_9ACTN|nr:ABC transporter substrate-binding protein [Actinomadura rayongensis]MXQ63686.1 extracellular solute-binding protein [Actinomadura rayongensis]
MGLRLLQQWKPALAVALVAGVAAACGGSGGTDESATKAAEAAKTRLANNPALSAMVAAANKEGALNLNWGLDGRSTLKNLTDAFKTAYGLNIKVTLTPQQNMPTNAGKLAQEYQAGKPSSTDAFLGNPESTFGVGPKGKNALKTIDWAKTAPWTKGLANSDNTALTWVDQIPGFTYNTTLIPKNEVPKTAQDVLKLTKPIASTPYAAQFNALGSKQAMGIDGVRSYLRSFKPKGYLGCGELNRIASGEFAALWVSCGVNIGDIFAAQGAPVATTVLKDAAIISTRYIGIPKNSAHPNAAELWATWLLTPEAQQIMYKGDFNDNMRLPGSKTAKQIAGYEAQGTKFIKLDYEFAAANPELYDGRFKGELIKLLTGK